MKSFTAFAKNNFSLSAPAKYVVDFQLFLYQISAVESYRCECEEYHCDRCRIKDHEDLHHSGQFHGNHEIVEIGKEIVYRHDG